VAVSSLPCFLPAAPQDSAARLLQSCNELSAIRRFCADEKARSSVVAAGVALGFRSILVVSVPTVHRLYCTLLYRTVLYCHFEIQGEDLPLGFRFTLVQDIEDLLWATRGLTGVSLILQLNSDLEVSSLRSSRVSCLSSWDNGSC